MQVAQVPSLVRELGSHVPQLRVHMSQLKRSRVPQIEKKKKILNATAKIEDPVCHNGDPVQPINKYFLEKEWEIQEPSAV